MTVKLQAPYPGIQVTSILPSPEFSDTKGQKIALTVNRSMTGTVRTYVKTNSRFGLTMVFILTRAKSLEVREFIRQFNAEHILLTTHRGEKWDVYLMNNPFEFGFQGRAAPDGERVEITLEFEGTKVA